MSVVIRQDLHNCGAREAVLNLQRRPNELREDSWYYWFSGTGIDGTEFESDEAGPFPSIAHAEEAAMAALEDLRRQGSDLFGAQPCTAQAPAPQPSETGQVITQPISPPVYPVA